MVDLVRLMVEGAVVPSVPEGPVATARHSLWHGKEKGVEVKKERSLMLFA